MVVEEMPVGFFQKCHMAGWGNDDMRHFECGNPIIKGEDLNSEFSRDQIILF